MRRFWVPIILAVLAAAVVNAPALAQPGLPPVDPAACTIAPIAIPEKGEVGDLSTPQPNPTPIATGNATPADQATTEAVSAAVAQSIACRNAGDQLRMLATFSDRWVAQLFSGYDLVFYNQFLQQVALPATPMAQADQIELVAIRDVVVRQDGAVLATVTTRTSGVEQTSRLLLIDEHGAWKIDGAENAA